jgi:signal transduction histidine kinase
VKFDRLEPLLENAVYRIAQEALTNVHRHSQSAAATIELTQKDDVILLQIQDQGAGFDPERVEERCYGLAGIRERARVLGGCTVIESAPGKGTRISVELPVVVSGLDRVG